MQEIENPPKITMHNALHSLIKDSIAFLKEQKRGYFFAKAEELLLLQTKDTREEPPPLSDKAQPLSSFTLPPLPERKKSASLEKKEKLLSVVQPTESIKVDLPARQTPSSTSFTPLKDLLSAIAPSYVIHKEAPSDAMAKQKAMSWHMRKKSAPITLIGHGKDPAKTTLLKNITHALEQKFSSVGLIFAFDIEKENSWEIFLSNPELKLVITTDSTIAEFPKLTSFYREIPARKEQFLHNTPLFLLPDLGLYLKQSSLKPLLWKTLTQKIQELFEKKSHEEIC